MKSATRTLVVPSPGLGTALVQLGTLEAIAASGRQISLLATEAQMAVLDPTLLHWRLADHPPESLELPISLEKSSTDASALRRHRFEEAVFLSGAGRDTVRAAARAGIPVRRGFGGRLDRLTQKVETRLEGPAPSHDAPLLATMDLLPSPCPLFVPATWQRTGLERLIAAKLAPQKETLIGVYIGDAGHVRPGRWRRRHWPAERFEELIELLHSSGEGRRIVILGGDDDLWQTVLLHERTGKIHPVIGPDLHYDGLAAVLHQLDLVVAGDSALLYLAAAVGAPTLGLFHPRKGRAAALDAPGDAFTSRAGSGDKDGRDDEDAGPRHDIVEHDLKTLTTEAVVARCEALLAGKSRAG